VKTRKGFDIALTIIIAFVIVIVLVAALGAITNSYTGRFLEFGNNATNTSLVPSAILIGGVVVERSD